MFSKSLTPHAASCEAHGNGFTAFSIKAFLALAVLCIVAPLTQAQVVISEFRTRGPNGGNDEFVEIYNNSDTPVDISGYMLSSASSSASISTRSTIPADSNTILPARGYYLFANSSTVGTDGPYSGTVTPDRTYTSSGTGIADNGSLAILNAGGAVVDAIGLNQTVANNAYIEGTGLNQITVGNSNIGYERRRVGTSNAYQDMGNNFADFILRAPSDPQNLATAAGTINANPGSPILISEFRTRGTGGATDEFTELYNNTDVPIDISAWRLISQGSASPSGRVAALAGTVIPARTHFLIANNGYVSNTANTVTPDLTDTSGGVANTGGVAITLPKSTISDTTITSTYIVDAVAIGPVPLVGSSGQQGTTRLIEGTPTLSFNSDTTITLERKRADTSLTTLQDTNNNIADFTVRFPQDPQNRASGTGVAPQPVFVTSATPVLISEFRTRGTGGVNDEFVEIYNNTNTAVDISGWLLNRSSSSGTTGFTLATVPANTFIAARGHYLIGNISYSGTPSADLTYTSPTDSTTGQPDAGIPDSGGIALIQSDGTTIADQVATSPASLYREDANGGTSLLQPNSDANASFERKRGGINIQDTGNNAADFQVLAPSQPQSSISPTATGSTIAGRVMTASGAPLAGVQVSLRDNSTGVVRRTSTDRAGRYIFTEVTTNSLYTVSALQREATFSNPSQTFSVTGDMVEVNFIGEARKGRAFSRTPRGK